MAHYWFTGRSVLAEGVIEMRWHDGSTMLVKFSSQPSPHLTIERTSDRAHAPRLACGCLHARPREPLRSAANVTGGKVGAAERWMRTGEDSLTEPTQWSAADGQAYTLLPLADSRVQACPCGPARGMRRELACPHQSTVARGSACAERGACPVRVGASRVRAHARKPRRPRRYSAGIGVREYAGRDDALSVRA
jgi:hypothetical protein